MSKRLFILMFFVSFLYCFGNILPQGNFESEKVWSLWPSGTSTIFTIDNTVFKEGKASGKIICSDMGQVSAIYTYAPMKENKKYKISLYFKTENLVPDSGNIKLQLSFNLKGGPNGSAGKKTINFPSGFTTTDWNEFKSEVIAPVGTDVAQVSIRFEKIKGTIWIDDMKIIEEKDESITIKKTKTPPLIDGIDEDLCWKDSNILTGFFIAEIEEKIAEKQTSVKMCYDENNMYLYFKCDEPFTKNLFAKTKERDGSVWVDDCVEVFISPESGKIYHFIINSKGVIYDSEITSDDKSVTGYITNKNYDSNIKVATKVFDSYWTVELSIPFSDLKITPKSGDRWLINFAREDKISNLNYTYSRLAGFFQFSYFSKILFGEESAILERQKFFEKSPLKIVREKPLFKELLSDQSGKYSTYIWYHSIASYDSLPPDIKNKFSKEEWEKEVYNQIEDLAKSGFMGLALPWAFSGRYFWEKEELWAKLYEKYGTKLKCCVEHGGVMSRAVKEGGEIVYDDGNIKYVSLIDPVYIKCAIEEINKWTGEFKNKLYVWTIEGRDEPNIYFWSKKTPEMTPKMKMWNEEILKNYGFGKFGMPMPNDPKFWENKENHPFQWIAFYRWASDKYAESKKAMYEEFKKFNAPNLEYVQADYWFMSGFVPFDYSFLARYTDILSCDPYASSAERREGRGIYNHGFGTKLLKDLGNGKPVITVVQAFHYAGYSPTPEDVREWVSQALKVGASRIEFYDDPYGRYRVPKIHNEMLRLSKIITKMNKVKIPDDPDTAIICSLDSEAAKNKTGECLSGDEIYTAYSILGEKIGCWFDFISDRQIERNENQLKKYKIVYLPLGKYMTKKVVEKIVDYVEKGGILVIGDPLAFEYNIDGTSLKNYREKITGVILKAETFRNDRVKLKGIEGFKEDEILIMKSDSIYTNIHLAYSCDKITKTSKIIGEFSNGKPAIIENKYGKGKVIYFLANPFAPDILLIETKLNNFIKYLQEKAGTKTDRPIWRFLLPSE